VTIFSYGADGAEAITLVNNPAPDYRPLTDSESFLDSSFFWSALPDDYDDLPSEDRAVAEAAWCAALQYSAGLLTEIAHRDQTASILNFPLRLQRKWLKFELLKSIDVGGGAPELVDATRRSRTAGLLRAPQSANETTLRLTPGNTHTGAYVDLTGTASSQAFLFATLLLQLRGDFPTGSTALDGPPPVAAEEGWFLYGYGDLDEERLAPGAYAALSTTRRLAAVVVRPDGTSRWAICNESVDATLFEEGVRLGVKSRPVSGGVEVTARVETSDPDTEYNVSLVDDVAFTVDHVVLTTVDSRIEVDSPNSGEVIDARVPFTATMGVMQWADPTVHASTRSIPTLQPKVSNSIIRYQQSVDYDVAWDDIAGYAELRIFNGPPEKDLWASAVAFDGGLIEKVWGTMSGVVSGPDTPQLLNLLAAIEYGLHGGPHPRPLSAAVGALSGAPMAVEDGVVIEVDTGPDTPVIVVRGFDEDRRYYYPTTLKRTVSVGDEVTKLQMLCEVPTIRDWTSGEELTSRLRLGHSVHALIRSEIEKFSAIHIEIPAGAVGVSSEFEGRLDSLPARLTKYLGDALALWLGSFRLFLALIHSIEDRVPLDDVADFDGEVAIRTPLTNARDPRYNEGAGYVYDGTLAYNEGDRDTLRDRLEVLAENTVGPPVVIHIFGADYPLAASPGPGHTVTVPEYV